MVKTSYTAEDGWIPTPSLGGKWSRIEISIIMMQHIFFRDRHLKSEIKKKKMMVGCWTDSYIGRLGKREIKFVHKNYINNYLKTI